MILPEDPRRLNHQFDLETTHVRGYADALSKALFSIDWVQLKRAIAKIEGTCERGARLWIAGNRGSAAIADRLCRLERRPG
jgi:D-sedoheptulose 7-phosphate isomerase